MNLKDWVLSRYSTEEEPPMQEGLAAAASGLELLVTQGVERAMNRVNTKSKAS